jgi:hypothetical protein
MGRLGALTRKQADVVRVENLRSLNRRNFLKTAVAEVASHRFGLKIGSGGLMTMTETPRQFDPQLDPEGR